MKTVLITAVGSASAAAALQSYHNAGFRVVACDIYPKGWTAVSVQADAFFQSVPATAADAYLAQMKEAVIREKVDYLIPLTDPEVDVLCAHHALFEALDCRICTPCENTVRLCRDKKRMAELLKEQNAALVIPTYTPSQWQPATEDYPLMVKPVSGRSSQHQHVVRDEKEYLKALSEREDWIVQPFLKGDVYTVDVARDAFGNTRCLARHELLRTGNGLGTTVRVLPAHELENTCARIAQLANIVGVVNMEFIEHDGKHWFLEVNPRFSGGLGFSHAAGMDFAQMEILCHNGEMLPEATAIRPMTITRKIEMLITEA